MLYACLEAFCHFQLALLSYFSLCRLCGWISTITCSVFSCWYMASLRLLALKSQLYSPTFNCKSSYNCLSFSLTYYILFRCSEDYRWWWKSFCVSGSTSLYVFTYSVVYFAKLESTLAVTYMLYFGYMGLISMGFFLITG